MYNYAIWIYLAIGVDMSLQPQGDVEFINTMFAQEGRKALNPFKLKRLDNAIKALEYRDTIQGISARAYYYCHQNQYELAMSFLDKAIKENGYNQIFANTKVIIVRTNGEWSLLKSESENILMTTEFNVEEERIIKYITDSELYIDNTGKFMEILNKYGIEERHQISSQIELKAEQVISQGVDLSTYRKVLAISIKEINKEYDLSLSIEFNTTNLQIIFSSDLWTSEETVDLTKKINRAILSDEDLDFQIAADDIEVFCINFPIEKLPEDFIYYEENDDDLIELIESRMTNNLSPEVDGEELHV